MSFRQGFQKRSSRLGFVIQKLPRGRHSWLLFESIQKPGRSLTCLSEQEFKFSVNQLHVYEKTHEIDLTPCLFSTPQSSIRIQSGCKVKLASCMECVVETRKCTVLRIEWEIRTLITFQHAGCPFALWRSLCLINTVFSGKGWKISICLARLRIYKQFVRTAAWLWPSKKLFRRKRWLS